LFPKFPDRLSATAWELWFFDGGSNDGKMSFTCSFFRDGRGNEEGGWRVQVFALWPDGSMWKDEVRFAESVVTVDRGSLNGPAQGRVDGVWRDRDNHSSASFTVEPQLGAATIRFDIKERVEGTVVLTALDGNHQGLPSSEAAALLCPDMYYVRPISLANAKADIIFHGVEMDSGPPEMVRDFKFVSGRGGMDRCWSTLSWPQLLSESYFLRAKIGPYNMQVMRILTPEFSGRKPHAIARLWKNEKVICQAQQAVDLADLAGRLPDEDAIAIEKVRGTESGKGVTGAFRDKNVGYAIHFIKGTGSGTGNKSSPDGLQWRFDVRHTRPWWNMPTSPPGPDATGNSGFLESVEGGAQGEAWPPGTGRCGQLELR
jgi:hypothetical protein